MQIEFIPRKSAILSSSSLACLADVASVNVTSSCVHRCIYCYSCGYSMRPTEGTVVVYANLVEKLKAELPRKRQPPKTVYFYPSSDLFQPIPEVLTMSFEMIAFLLSQDVNVAIKESLERNIVDKAIFRRIFNQFSGSKRLSIHADRSSVTVIPREEREAIFRKIHGIASRHGLSLHICGCKNPDILTDFCSKNCRLSGEWNQAVRSRSLLDIESF